MVRIGLISSAVDKINLELYEHKRTPRCSYEVSAASLSWLKHSRVQCCYLATKPEVRVESFVAS